MNRRVKFIAGGLIIVAALGYLVYAGVSQSMVYFVTPSELRAAPVSGKAYRLGGMVERGSLKWERRHVERRGLLQGLADPREAFGGIQGAARLEPGRLQRAAEDPEERLER